MFGIPPKLRCLFCLDEYTSGSTTTRELLRCLAPGCRTQSVFCLLLTHSTADSWLQHCSTRPAVFCLDKSTSNKYCVQRGRVDEWYCLKLQYSSSSNKCKSRKTNPLVTASAAGNSMSMVRWSQSVLVAVPHSSHQLPALAAAVPSVPPCDECGSWC